MPPQLTIQYRPPLCSPGSVAPDFFLFVRFVQPLVPRLRLEYLLDINLRPVPRRIHPCLLLALNPTGPLVSVFTFI
jgi:hypothetical protein